MRFLPLFLLFINLLMAQEVRVSAIVQGRVERVFVRENQRVEKGDPLVQVDPVLYTTQKSSLLAQLNSQKVSLEKTERDFRRYEELFNRGLLSKSEYEDWKSKYEKELANYEALRAQLERTEKLIEYCTIRSPVRGVVKRLFVREGLFINGTLTSEPLLIVEEK